MNETMQPGRASAQTSMPATISPIGLVCSLAFISSISWSELSDEEEKEHRVRAANTRIKREKMKSSFLIALSPGCHVTTAWIA